MSGRHPDASGVAGKQLCALVDIPRDDTGVSVVSPLLLTTRAHPVGAPDQIAYVRYNQLVPYDEQ